MTKITNPRWDFCGTFLGRQRKELSFHGSESSSHRWLNHLYSFSLWKPLPVFLQALVSLLAFSFSCFQEPSHLYFFFFLELSLPLSVSLCLSSITQCIPLQDSQFSCSFIILLNKKHVWTDSFKKVQSGREDMSWPITYHIFSVTLGTSRIWTDTCHLLLPCFSCILSHPHWLLCWPLGLPGTPSFGFLSLKCFSEMFPMWFTSSSPSFLTKVMFPRRPQISIPDISSRLSLQHLALSNIVCVLLTCLFYIHFPFIKHRKVGSFVFYFYTTLL